MSLELDESKLHEWVRKRVALMRELGIQELETAGLRIVLRERLKSAANKRSP